MASNISRSDVGSWKRKAIALRARMERNRAAATQTVETVIHTTEVSSAAFVAGVVQGRYGGVELLGVPVDLALAVGLHTAAFIGLAGKSSSHLHGFADGFLAAFLTTTGRGVGQAWAAKNPPKALQQGIQNAATSGLPGRGSYLSDDDRRLAAMAASM